jgi:hypothetical protein
MGIFKCLQRLRHSCCRSRLFLLLFAAVVVMVALATALSFSKRPLKEHVLRCCQENKVVLFFSSSESLTPSQICLPFNTTQNLDATVTRWKVAALQTTSIGELMAEFSLQKYLLPLIAVIQDSLGAEYLAICGEDRHIFLSSMKYLIEHCLIDRKNEKWVEVIVPDPLEGKKEPFSLYIAIF